MPKLKLTKSNIDKISQSNDSQIDYFDTELTGFGLRVSTTTKTYFVMGRVNGKLIRVGIGKHGPVAPDEARKRALSLLGNMSNGINPNAEKKKNQERGITISAAYDKYLEIRKPLEITISTDRSLMKNHLHDWLNKPIAEITKDMVAKRHRSICDKSGDHAGNNTFRMFRRVYNCINSHLDETLPPNPVNRLSATKQWAKVGRRQTIIKDNDLPAWYTAVQSITNPFMRNLLLLLFLTGFRKSEGLSLEWEHVDMIDKTFSLIKTKNGKPHTLPMSDFLFQLFSELQGIRLNEYVFPSFVKNGKTKHMMEPKRHVKKIKEDTGIEFCPHDLRRVFKTTAQDTVTKAESDRLTNHTSKDAGDGYIILSSPEKVREPMQRITTKLILLSKAWSHFPEGAGQTFFR